MSKGIRERNRRRRQRRKGTRPFVGSHGYAFDTGGDCVGTIRRGTWQDAREAVREYFENQIAMVLGRLGYVGRIGIYHANVGKNSDFNTSYRHTA